MSVEERLILLLALIPHICPQLLDTFFIPNNNINRIYTEFGGWTGAGHNGFLPTGETAIFILAGKDITKRLTIGKLFDTDHFFYKHSILHIDAPQNNEPFLSGPLIISPEYLSLITTGIQNKPDYNIHFPAKLITTPLEWDELVLPTEVSEEIENLRTWIHHSDTLVNKWGLGKNLKRGCHSLFYGPPGTGKTLAATLIGKLTQRDVYRIDLSMMVSKYIGDTEKNLSTVFDQAENRDWILFFDEADSLFGQRTNTTNANDHYANQQKSYLLQRIEDFPGVVILATNLKGNIDGAFARRIQFMVHFPMPDREQRLKLWQNIASDCPCSDNVDMEALANEHELAGGGILNAVRYAAIRAIKRQAPEITQEDLLKGVEKEFEKEDRTL